MIDPEVMRRLDQQASLVRQLQGALGGRTVAVGTGSATWSASSTSAAVDVEHGLPDTPTAVIVQEVNAGFRFAVGATDSTDFTVTGYTTAGNSVSATRTFFWIAIT